MANENQSETLPMPEQVRSRLNDLAKKLDHERRSLDEARSLREVEVKALQAEMAKREATWKSEYQEKENQWNKAKLALEDSARKLKDQNDELSERHHKEIQDLGKRHEAQLNKVVDEFERLLEEARKSWKEGK